MLLSLSQASERYHHSKHYKDRSFLRSFSTFHPEDLEKSTDSHQLRFARLLSHHPHRMPDEFDDFPMTREDFLHSFRKGNIAAESDEADDEDDERTPTVERSEPKFQ